MSSSKQKYIIKPYSYQQAEKLGVQIFSSDNPKKKIEVYDVYILAIHSMRTSSSLVLLL